MIINHWLQLQEFREKPYWTQNHKFLTEIIIIHLLNSQTKFKVDLDFHIRMMGCIKIS